MKEADRTADRNDVMQLVRDLAANQSLDTGMINTLHTALNYFDTLTDKLKAKYERDIHDAKLTRNQLWVECYTFLRDHGHGKGDYRNNFIVASIESIISLPRDYALIKIGGPINTLAQCEAHSQFYKKAEFVGEFDEIIESLEPKFIGKPQIDFIRGLNEAFPAKPAAWKKRIQRFYERRASGELKRDTID